MTNHKIDIYDTGDKTIDRYTVIIDDFYVYGMSEARHGKLAFNQFCYDARTHSVNTARQGKKLDISDVSEPVQQAIKARV